MRCRAARTQRSEANRTGRQSSVATFTWGVQILMTWLAGGAVNFGTLFHWLKVRVPPSEPVVVMRSGRAEPSAATSSSPSLLALSVRMYAGTPAMVPVSTLVVRVSRPERESSEYLLQQ